MNRPQARKLAETITNDQLKTMFDDAKAGIKNWTKISSCNKGFTKGVAWNILAKDFDINHNYHILAKTNMIREFGEFLSYSIRHQEKKKKDQGKPMHHDPIFK